MTHREYTEVGWGPGRGPGRQGAAGGRGKGAPWAWLGPPKGPHPASGGRAMMERIGEVYIPQRSSVNELAFFGSYVLVATDDGLYALTVDEGLEPVAKVYDKKVRDVLAWNGETIIMTEDDVCRIDIATGETERVLSVGYDYNNYLLPLSSRKFVICKRGCALKAKGSANDVNGNYLWEANIGYVNDRPLVFDDYLLVPTDKGLAKLHLKTGMFQYLVEGDVKSAVAFGDKILVVAKDALLADGENILKLKNGWRVRRYDANHVVLVDGATVKLLNIDDFGIASEYDVGEKITAIATKKPYIAIGTTYGKIILLRVQQ